MTVRGEQEERLTSNSSGALFIRGEISLFAAPDTRGPGRTLIVIQLLQFAWDDPLTLSDGDDGANCTERDSEESKKGPIW